MSNPLFKGGNVTSNITRPDIEQAIVAMGANKAPRITPDHIEAAIVGEYYINAGEAIVLEHRGPLDLLTFCVLVLRNGFTVTGESACASPENFNLEIGRRIARENARNKIWALEGYLLRDKLAGHPTKD